MKRDKEYLYNAFNATSTDDGKGGIESYENWLERQLINRMEHIDELEKANEVKASDESEIICFKAKHEIMSITTKHKHCPDCGFKLANLG